MVNDFLNLKNSSFTQNRSIYEAKITLFGFSKLEKKPFEMNAFVACTLESQILC